MNIQSEALSETRKSFTVTIPSDLYQEEEKASLASLAQQVRIPGFRPGKVPTSLLQTRYAKDIVDNVKRGLVQRALDSILEQEKEGLESFVEVGELTEDTAGGSGYQVKIVADVIPSFELPNYEGIEIKLPAIATTDEEVEKALEGVRAQRADFKVVERAAAKGDYAKIAYEAILDGKPLEETVESAGAFGSQKTTWEEVASESAFLPAVSKALEGLAAGENTEVQETFGDDHQIEALRGLTVTYKVEVQEVRERALPELDEEFFKSLKVKDLEELKSNVRRDVEREKEYRDQEAQRGRIVEFLSGAVDIQIPESLIERHTERSLKRVVDDNVRRGVSQDILEQHRDEIFEGARKNAVSQAKIDLILQKIAAKEKISVSQEDLSEAVFRMAYYSGQNPKKIVSEIRKDRSRLTSLSSEILLRKTMDWLVEKANLVREDKES